MECGWSSPEQIAACIYLGKIWFQVLADVFGLGTFALITLLIWLFGRLRQDLKKWEDETKRERDLRHRAEEVARNTKHIATLAEREAVRARQAFDKIARTVTAGEDGLRKQLADAQATLSETTQCLNDALEMTEGGSENFWSRAVGNRFAGYEIAIAGSIPIVMFGNQKGGVGKTTIVANLAAAFALRGEKVLAVDLDYQGSLSSLMRLQSEEETVESLLDYIFEEELDEKWPQLTVRKAAENLYYIPAFYSFELVERRVEYRWVLKTASDDVRYRLARALCSEEIQTKFDRVLIDAPPRFTLGFVNGFCAATHLYVPTVVDTLSASAVGLFARQFSKLKPVANPNIRWAGIIGTMTNVAPQAPLALPGTQTNAADAAEREAQYWLGTREELFIRNPVIKRDAPLARATETGIAYLNDSEVRSMFDALATVIQSKAPRRSRT